ncbi:hypothetical protein ACMGDK_18665 [Chryseobacterium sp. DT-3]|uniref:hypothetical protein n=1 Tax=Chryseobacterium sp. DT-3 TaxID=3396164 RepID=UPI003F1A1083
MKKLIFTLICTTTLVFSSCSEDSHQEKEVQEQNQVVTANKSVNKTQQEIDNLLKYFTTKDYHYSVSGLTKEEVQKDMAMKLLPKCKQLLMENGYTEDAINKFDNDYKAIILTAFNLKK